MIHTTAIVKLKTCDAIVCVVAKLPRVEAVGAETRGVVCAAWLHAAAEADRSSTGCVKGFAVF